MLYIPGSEFRHWLKDQELYRTGLWGLLTGNLVGTILYIWWGLANR